MNSNRMGTLKLPTCHCLVLLKATENEQLWKYSVENYCGSLILCCKIVLTRLKAHNETVTYTF